MLPLSYTDSYRARIMQDSLTSQVASILDEMLKLKDAAAKN